MCSTFFDRLCPAELASYCHPRAGETKIGQAIKCLESSFSGSGLQQAYSQGCRWAILGISEDLGVRANLGRAGADSAWEAFLETFLNQQSNDMLPVEQIVLLGSVNCRDLLEQSWSAKHTSVPVPKLRQLCEQLDERVAKVIASVVASGLCPIVIGGGHNNALPIIRGTSCAGHALSLEPAARHKCLASADSWQPSAEARHAKLVVVNCDPHADYRALEGRHSGNGFSYAAHYGLIEQYWVAFLQEAYNSAPMLERMVNDGVQWFSFESVFVRHELSWAEAVARLLQALAELGNPVGVELDLDSIENLPCSAQTSCGLKPVQAASFIYSMASQLPCAYLHLPEGAPSLDPVNGKRSVGRVLSLLVSSFIRGTTSRKQS